MQVMLMLRILAILLCVSVSFCAVPATTVWELNASATSSNVNGGGFDYANTTFPADYTATSATGASAVLASASYNFVAGDVGAWVYIKTGGNWGPSGTTGCFYQIASVASNQATLSSAAGQGVCIDPTKGPPSPKWIATSAAGVASTASPTGGTVGIDYSQGTSAIITFTDLLIGGTTTQVTSTLNPLGVNHIGNNIRINSGTNCTTGWYNIASVSGSTATLDASAGTATSVCGAKLGGAMSLNSTLDDDLFEKATATNGTGANRFFFKQGTYAFGEAVTLSVSGGTQAPIVLEGYVSLRGDQPMAATRPVWGSVAGTLGLSLGSAWDIYSLIILRGGSTGTTLTLGANNKVINTKVVSAATTAGTSAITVAANNYLFGVEAVSYRGIAVNVAAANAAIHASYIHDSNVGVSSANGTQSLTMSDCVLEGNVTNAIVMTTNQTGYAALDHLTIYGAENKLGACVQFATGTTNARITNSIIYGCTTGITHADTQTIGFGNYNAMFNNTNNVSAAGQWQTGANSVAVDPQFAGVAQLTGSTATTSGSVLTQSGGDFSTVVDGRDYLYLKSGTGVTVGVYGITSHTATTVTLDIAPGTNATADKVWQITTGHNFAVGNTTVRTGGFPGAFPGALTTGYAPIGAATPQSSGGGQKGYTWQ